MHSDRLNNIPSRQYEDFKRRATHTWGDRLDLSEIATKFLPYFQSGTRVKVYDYGREITGTVSVTTGWRPSLILVRRSNSLGSSDLLRPDTPLVAVQHGKTYVPSLEYTLTQKGMIA